MRTINLIPREGKKETQSRRRLLMMAGLGALFVLLLAAITVWRQGAVDDAREDLEAQLSANQSLQAEVAALAGAEDIQNQFNAEAATLSLALANDVSWGRLLVDLGRVIPDKVWVTSYSGSVNRLTADSTEDAGIGQISFSGIAFEPPDVSAWIRVLDSEQYPGVVSSWATGLTKSAIADVEVTNFGSTTALSAGALSDRIFERIPDIP